MTDPRLLDTPMGHPILSRHADDVAMRREPLVSQRHAVCVCGRPVSVGLVWWGFCVECCEQLPESIRERLYRTYQMGAKQQPAAWQAAHDEARQMLNREGK
jgi:hypothetical protein